MAQYGDQTTMHDVHVGGEQQQPPAAEQQQYGQQQYPQQYDQSPQYIGGQPAPPQTYTQAQPAPAGAAGATGCTGESLRRVLTSPDGILRLVEWLCALVQFAAMASATGYSNFSQFQFLVAAGVLTWIWTMAMLTSYIFDLAGKNPMLNVVELGVDFVLIVFEFAAGIASAVECNTNPCNGCPALCSGVDDAKAGVAFAFLAFFALCGSLFFDYKKWRGAK